MIRGRSVSWRRVQRRFVGISSMPSKGDVTGSGETESGADKIPAMDASLGVVGFSPAHVVSLITPPLSQHG